MNLTNLKRLMEWFPAIALFTALGEAPRGVPRVLAFLQLMRFVATKTAIRQDDELMSRLEAICLTPEGKALIDFISDEIASLMKLPNAAT